MRIMTFMQKNRWTWSAAGVVVLWLVLAVVTGRWSVASLSGILVSASFLTLAGLGQMLVVSTGRGNIDLSIGAVMTLSAFVSLLVIKGQDGLVWLGLLAAVFLLFRDDASVLLLFAAAVAMLATLVGVIASGGAVALSGPLAALGWPGLVACLALVPLLGWLYARWQKRRGALH